MVNSMDRFNFPTLGSTVRIRLTTRTGWSWWDGVFSRVGDGEVVAPLFTNAIINERRRI
jgi:hypothetical protein